MKWTPTLSNLFAGLLTISDWIGSSERFFPFAPEADDDPDGYWNLARDRARRVVRQVGARPSSVVSLQEGALYRHLFPATFPDYAPTSLQKLTGSMELPPPGCLLAIESETGSGKTEAVLALYARLRSAGRVDGLVFALPTRATAKAMRERIAECVARLHPDGAPPTLAVAMGGEGGGAQAPDGATLDPDLYPDAEDAASHQWASDHHKKFLAAEIVVGTVDQVLLAGLPIKHAHMRLALLVRHLVVIDEVHSHDRYMNTVLGRILAYNSRVGGLSVCLSATLSRETRNRLAGGEVDCDLAEAQSAPYPSLSLLRSNESVWTSVATAPTGSPKRVRWVLASQASAGTEVFDEAIKVARAGGRVCILRNTVGEAMATVRLLEENAPELLWRPGDADRIPAYHSRFIAADRRRMDDAVLSDFGKDSTRAGVILVSTQVIEQSLDVDFDWMMSDLAPVDVLLQRIGRLHRHDRPRPSTAAVARFLVQAPPEPFPPRKELRNQGFGWGTVYKEVSDLELTRRLIETWPEIVIPRDNRRLVEAVYHPDAREALAEEDPQWAEAVIASDGRELAQSTAGEMGALAFDEPYSRQTPQYDAASNDRIRTRLGDDRITVRLDEPVHGWYAPMDTADEVAVRLDQLVRAAGVDLADPKGSLESESDDGPLYRIGHELLLRYTPLGWVDESG